MEREAAAPPAWHARPGAPGAKPLLLLGAAIALTLYVVVWPFLWVRYPPLTDLPFHAAETSILRHYLDPAFHFREQFTLHPLEVPYLTMYVLGAALALVFPITIATKGMAIAMLLLVPAGLAVLCHGMRKSPLGGLAALPLTWCTVTQWGFLNFMGALGLLAMSLGFALLVVDRPTRGRQLGLGVTLVLLFFTHVFRFPFAFLGVLAAGVLVFPATRRFRPLLWPLAPAAVLFLAWQLLRKPELGIGLADLGLHPERLGEIRLHLFGSYQPIEGAPATPEGNAERALSGRMLATLGAAIATAIVLFFRDGRARGRTAADRRWGACVTALPLLCALGFLVGYLTLPYQVGQWFYVYPREMTAVALMLLAAAPDLPATFGGRAAFTLLFAAASVPMAGFVTARFREFERATEDFRAITREIPSAPRLFHLLYWLGDSAKRVPPFLHLPAWIQAEKGGTLGVHFVQWGHSPIRYREGSPDVPPRFAERFEWEPQHFRVLEHGPWFDTFLVRHTIDPHQLFDPDPSIHLVARRGTWWLYRRSR